MQNARPASPARSHAPGGFSLIELLVTVAVLAVLASLAIPSFASIARQYRLDAVTDELMASIHFAKVEAIRLGQDIVIRRQATCDVVLSSTADWRCGWQVFADLNDNQLLDGAETVTQSISIPPGIRLEKRGGGSPQYAVITRFGRASSWGQRFSVFPESMGASDGQLICFSTGSRPRKVKGVEECPDSPGATP